MQDTAGHQALGRPKGGGGRAVHHAPGAGTCHNRGKQVAVVVVVVVVW
jgi:hypothetical protein